MKSLNETPKEYKRNRLKQLLSCSFCKPHRGENREKVKNHKTRKDNRYQFTKHTSSRGKKYFRI